MLKEFMQLALGGAGAFASAVGIWLAFHFARHTNAVMDEKGDNPFIFLYNAFAEQTRLVGFTLAALMFLAGCVLIVGACIVHRLDRD